MGGGTGTDEGREEVIYLSHGARGLGGKPGAWFVVRNATTLSGVRPPMREVVQSLLDANRMVFEVSVFAPDDALIRPITDAGWVQ